MSGFTSRSAGEAREVQRHKAIALALPARSAAVETRGNVGAEAGGQSVKVFVADRHLPETAEQPKRGGRIRRAAANAGCDRQSLVENERGSRFHPAMRGERPGGAQDEIVALSRQSIGKRPGHRKAETGCRRDAQQIAILGKGENGLDLVIAVRRARADMQRQVDLGESGFLHWRA